MKARLLVMIALSLLLLTENVRANMEEDFPPPVDFEDEMSVAEASSLDKEFAKLPADTKGLETTKKGPVVEGSRVGTKFTKSSKPASTAPRAGVRKPASKAVASKSSKKNSKAKIAAMKKLNAGKKASR